MLYVTKPRVNSLTRLFDDVANGFSGFDDFFSNDYSSSRTPAIDVQDTDKAIVVSAEMPGIKSEEIDISLEQNVLAIKGEKNTENEKAEDKFYLKERTSNSFVRKLRLPCDVDEAKIKADYKDGILSINLPKMKKEKKIKIDVK